MNNILQWNSDGLLSHLDEFNLIVKKYNPYICCIQETKFKSNFDPNLKHFKTFYKNVDSETIAHGGVAILVNSNF